ncbi:MAG: septum site-determining protein MinC [Butyrivibrio sp.]|nr:septum site-determining protein MinC [Muribaculum sp.]MCM1552231.1 septum site-determining protein MinC [Butyrivibrio sp.]
MRDAVLIKSFPNGISLILNEELPFEDIIREIEFKFSEAKAFFGRASMALSIDGRTVTDEEERQVLEAIHKSSNLNIVCVVGHDEETDKNYIKALQQVEKRLSNSEESQFYKGTLKDNQVIETEGSIVILGDVYPGCAVISARNIIILGGLYGEAYAGGNGQEGAYVVALEMEPERLKIGDFKYKYDGKKPKWSIRPKVQPKIAYVKNERVVFDALTKELLSSF